MKCLHCNTQNHAEDTICLSCGKPLNKEPFTSEQRMWHIFNAFAPLVGIGILFFSFQVFDQVSSSFENQSNFGGFSILWWVFLAIAAATIGVSLYQNLMDLIGGVTRAHTAKLTRKYRSSSRKSRRYFAEFEQIGRVNLPFHRYESLEEGAIYKVVFSPNTKRGWEFEKQ